MIICAQYNPNPVDGTYLLRRRVAQHPLLPQFGLFRGHWQLLRSLLHCCLLLPHVPLHRARPAQSKRIFPWNPAQAVAVAVELVSKVEVLLWAPRGVEEPSQRVDMV